MSYLYPASSSPIGLRFHLGHEGTHRVQQILPLKRFGEGAVGTKRLGNRQHIQFPCFPSSGNGEYFYLRKLLPEYTDGFDAFLFWHKDVRNDKVHWLLSQLHQALSAVLRVCHLMACSFQGLPYYVSYRSFVINDQNPCHLV